MSNAWHATLRRKSRQFAKGMMNTRLTPSVRSVHVPATARRHLSSSKLSEGSGVPPVRSQSSELIEPYRSCLPQHTQHTDLLRKCIASGCISEELELYRLHALTPAVVDFLDMHREIGLFVVRHNAQTGRPVPFQLSRRFLLPKPGRSRQA